MVWHRGPSQTNDRLFRHSNFNDIFKQKTTSNWVVELNIYTFNAYLIRIDTMIYKEMHPVFGFSKLFETFSNYFKILSKNVLIHKYFFWYFFTNNCKITNLQICLSKVKGKYVWRNYSLQMQDCNLDPWTSKLMANLVCVTFHP